MLGVVGVLMLIGAVPQGDVSGSVGGVCVLGASFCVVRADGPKATLRRPAPVIPSLRAELACYTVALTLVILGVVLTAV